MSQPVIRIQNISKQYHIGVQKQHDTLLYSLADTFVAPARRIRRLLSGHRSGAAELDETFWALRDVNLEVQQGEVVGIIGHNGAGKSTLLKILSRITEPTSGYIHLWGRVASLLEVGTGFHPELTGRENIYLNGAILGMRRHEIDSKFDEIVAFSEVEQFIDTPIKHYSSGMTVRLAFAVAAHLEPEILLIDEVLAVGDVAFQRKSLGKMSDVASEGRTVLFVSHNLGAIANLCERCVLLDHGQVTAVGTPAAVIPQYLTRHTEAGGRVRLDTGNPDIAMIHEAGILNDKNEFVDHIDIKQPFKVWLRYHIHQPLEVGQIAIAVVESGTGTVVFASTHIDQHDETELTLLPGHYEASVQIPGHFLNRGTYTINFRIWGVSRSETRKAHASALHALLFNVVETGSILSKVFDNRRGLVIPLLDWDIKNRDE